MPGLGFPRSLNREQIAGYIPHGAFRVLFGFGPARPAEQVERRPGFASANILADQMRFGDWHVELWRRLQGVIWSILEDEAFLTRTSGGQGVVRRLRAGTRRHQLEAHVPPDAVLQVNDIISLFQI